VSSNTELRRNSDTRKVNLH